MDTWFLAAVCGALLAGVSNFYFKIAAKRGYNSELFSFYSGANSIIITVLFLLVFPQALTGFGWVPLLAFGAGTLASFAGIFKVYALRHIDSTIYFPLFKLLAPALAIAAGIIIFAESFTFIEWFGMMLGLLVPLMLITRSENGRQSNLVAGLVLVLVTSFLSAGGAIIGKYAIDYGMSPVVMLLYLSIGIFVSTSAIIVYKKGLGNLKSVIITDTNSRLITSAFFRSSLISISVALMYFAFAQGGTLAVVQTIHSMYILIPIVLAIIVYKEHWNFQKATAIVLSVGALVLLG